MTIRNKKWVKRILWVLATPVLLFIILMILLYIPPVQNFVVKEVASSVSKKTGMKIHIGRIDLRFPLNLLVRDSYVVDPKLKSANDTLLQVQSVNVHIQAWPLFRGQVEIDDITLKDGYLNSARLIDGMNLQGYIGYFNLQSHGVDLDNEKVYVNRTLLENTDLKLSLDTVSEEKDTASAPVRWNIDLEQLKVKNFKFALQMPSDSLNIRTALAKAELEGLNVNLAESLYRLKRIELTEGSVRYDVGLVPSAVSPGIDPSHLWLNDINIGVNSVYFKDKTIYATVKHGSFYERSGLTVSTIAGAVRSTKEKIEIPGLEIKTPHSFIDLKAQVDVQDRSDWAKSLFDLHLRSYIGKEDVLLLTGSRTPEVERAYPYRPIVCNLAVNGGMRQINLPKLELKMPGAFSLTGKGRMDEPADSLLRKGKFDLDFSAGDVNFIRAFAGKAVQENVRIPEGIQWNASFTVNGPKITASSHLDVEEGQINLLADYHLGNERHHAKIDIVEFPTHSFLPKDSVFNLSATFEEQGQGTSLQSRSTKIESKFALQHLRYARWTITNVQAAAAVRAMAGSLQLSSDNPLLRMRGEASTRFDRPYINGNCEIDINNINLHQLGVLSEPVKGKIDFYLRAKAGRDSADIALEAGDLFLKFSSATSLDKFLARTGKFSALLEKQLKNKRLDNDELRKVLPSGHIAMLAGVDNPLSHYLKDNSIVFNDADMLFDINDRKGINGAAHIHRLKVDSLRMDTVFLNIRQDTTRIKLLGGVINGPDNPQAVYRATMKGEVRSDDADLMLSYIDGEGNTGVDFGVNARALSEGKGKGDGLLLTLAPREPVIAFRKFHFEKLRNWIYVHKNKRVYANVEMNSDDGLGFKLQSDKNDSISLQNMNVELDRLNLDELSGILPYLPHLSGLFSVEARYVQTPTSLQVSTEANIKGLQYEHRPVGDIGAGVTWLPAEEHRHYLNTYLTCDGNEVLTADGVLRQRNTIDSMSVDAHIEQLPLKVANAFVPDGVATLDGNINGDIHFSGPAADPKVNGRLTTAKASVFSKQAGTLYHIEDNPLVIKNNRLLFENFTILTTSESPFIIDGDVNFKDYRNPMADLTLFADDYTLLDAPRTKDGLVYGKAFVDIAATIKGPLSGLVMRGHMDLLGKTNVTYILTDSPLTVEDRLSGLVTFTSFNIPESNKKDESLKMPLGGMNLNMTLHIDDAVRLRADLTPDRSKYIELEGGGDLSMKYNAQGEIGLTGKYTLSGGTMKYSLPIIPLKEFSFNQGSYVAWNGDPMNPRLSLKATEKMRASVAEEGSEQTRPVNFDVSVIIKNKLSAPDLSFDISAPDDAGVQNELAAMSFDDRNKAAITMLATGMYINSMGKGKGLTMGNALNSVLQSQINALTNSIHGASLSVGVEDRTAATGDKQTDYSFRYSQRFFNNRINVIIGGKVSTGANATNSVQSFIDNLSVEYRLDNAGTKYIQVFYDKNYESILDGEITEGGAGLVFRRKVDNLSELFLFQRKKDKKKGRQVKKEEKKQNKEKK